jgi:hypothetical protein
MARSRYFCRMKYEAHLSAAVALLSAGPVHAIVGGGAPQADGVARSVVTIVGSRGNFCTGSVIAPKIVLTAAHCVQPGAEYRIVDYSAGAPALQNVKTVAIHPGFRMEAMRAHRATADVALLQLEQPAKGKAAATLGMPNIRLPSAAVSPSPASASPCAATARAAARSALPDSLPPASRAPCKFVSSIPSSRERAGAWRLHRRFRRARVRG